MKHATLSAFLLFSMICGCEAQNGPVWENELRNKLNLMADHLTATLTPWKVPDKVYRVEDFGAVADGATVNSEAINRAISVCSKEGGGVVLFSKGDYVTGTMDLKSGVMLEITTNAQILGSTNHVDYPARIPKRPTVMDSNMSVKYSLIYAEGCERIGIRGGGKIDGRGAPAFFPKRNHTEDEARPFLIRVIDCRKVVVEHVSLVNSATWLQDYLNCEDLILQGITVFNHNNVNNDGIDVDGCRNVIVRDCVLDSDDDALCFKGASFRPCENVLVEHCRFYSTASNALKFGTDSQGDFRNVLVRDVELGKSRGPAREGDPTFIRAQVVKVGPTSAIAWEVVDGGVLENVLVSNARINGARVPLFLRLGNRGRVLPGMPKPKPGILRRVIFENCTSEEREYCIASHFSGIPSAKIEDVVVRNMSIRSIGGGKAQPVGEVVPELEADYPEAGMFFWPYKHGTPAYGFWVRHATGVHFFNVTVCLENPDERPCFMSGGDTENITVDGKPLESPPATAAAIPSHRWRTETR